LTLFRLIFDQAIELGFNSLSDEASMTVSMAYFLIESGCVDSAAELLDPLVSKLSSQSPEHGQICQKWLQYAQNAKALDALPGSQQADESSGV